MKFGKYLKDKVYLLTVYIFFYITLLLILFAFKCQRELIVAISIIYLTPPVIALLIDYFRKKKYYTDLIENIKALDKSYLVLETLSEPTFYEGKILHEALYEIDKSMCENVAALRTQVTDFKEYIEMWIHEVKIPISSLSLMAYNSKDKFDDEMRGEMKRIEEYVEQVLYYARAENAEKDYLIKKTDLGRVITNVALKYKDMLLLEGIDFEVKDVSREILTDSKWLEFILGQIVSNAIKYRSLSRDSHIEISSEEFHDSIALSITDNGIGISAKDLPRVFDKSFTGSNGRARTKSTGMGLFIAKKLSKKLGHKIEITSREDEYTTVTITFYKDRYYDVLK